MTCRGAKYLAIFFDISTKQGFVNGAHTRGEDSLMVALGPLSLPSASIRQLNQGRSIQAECLR